MLNVNYISIFKKWLSFGSSWPEGHPGDQKLLSSLSPALRRTPMGCHTVMSQDQNIF